MIAGRRDTGAWIWAAALATALCASASTSTSADNAGACPTGFHRDDAHAARLISQLRTHTMGRPAARAVETGQLVLCFGPIASSSIVASRRVALLDVALPVREAAARTAHLHAHTDGAVPWVTRQHGRCDLRVQRALRAEAEALTLELALRAAWQVAVHSAKKRYALEADFRRAAAADRAQLVFTFLRDHPDGAEGIPSLARDYAARCTRQPP